MSISLICDVTHHICLQCSYVITMNGVLIGLEPNIYLMMTVFTSYIQI